MAGDTQSTVACATRYYSTVLQESGVVRIPSLLTREQVGSIRDWIGRVVASGRDIPASFDAEFEMEGQRGAAVRKLRRLFWNDEPFWRQIFTDSNLPTLASILVGAPVALTFHAAFLKPGGIGSAIVLHQDQALWRYDYPGAISIWATLSQSGTHNGCMVGCCGSHLRGLLIHRELPDHPWHPGIEWEAEGLQNPTPFESQAGDGLAWHRYFVHGSGPNRSTSVVPATDCAASRSKPLNCPVAPPSPKLLSAIAIERIEVSATADRSARYTAVSAGLPPITDDSGLDSPLGSSMSLQTAAGFTLVGAVSISALARGRWQGVLQARAFI